MDKLIEALKALLAGPDADRAKFAETVQSNAPALYQSIFQSGHDVGYGKKNAELTAAQTKATELETRITGLDAEMAKLKANPDTAALHKQYGDEMSRLKAEHKAALDTLIGRVVDEKRGRVITQLQAALTSGEKRLNGEYAAVLTERSDTRNRVKVEPDGTVTVLQKGKDIPFAAASVDAALAMLAEELKAEAPASFVLAGTDAGAGVPNSGAPTAPAGATMFDKIRNDVKSKGESAAKGDIKPHGAFAGLAMPSA